MDFGRLPTEHRVRAYGVDYAYIVLSSGGELYLTRYGWALSELVVPQAWFADQRYSREGQRLPGSTGTVYRVPAIAPVGATRDLVIKFSRVAQDVPLFVDKPLPEIIPRALLDTAWFNDPFEEFGLLMELRSGPFGRERPRILTKRPLAIYSPARRYELWQLGRKEWLFSLHSERLKADQEANTAARSVMLDLHRDYILAFQWVKGFDAESMFLQGGLSEVDMEALYYRSTQELAANGFFVLDNKPRHIILRDRNKGGGILRRQGKFEYALVDFELLKRNI